MAIIRSLHNKDKPYFQIKKPVLQDINISLEAKGLYAVLMSFEDEKIETDTICQLINLSKSRLFELLNELRMEVE